MEPEEVARSKKVKPGYLLSRKRAIILLIGFVTLLVIVLVLAALLAHETRKKEKMWAKRNAQGESQEKPLSCEVVIVGGGIAGLYMAESLMRLQKQKEVCLFERDSRFGGRVFDAEFSLAPNISLKMGAYRVAGERNGNNAMLSLVRRLGVPMYKMPPMKRFYNVRDVFSSSAQQIKVKVFPRLMKGPLANMTLSDMMAFIWENMTSERALRFPSQTEFYCQRLGEEGCLFYTSLFGVKRDYRLEQSTLSTYERNIHTSHSNEFYSPSGGLSQYIVALVKSFREFGVKLYLREKVHAIKRRHQEFLIITNNFSVTAKKVIVAIPNTPLKNVRGDIALDIQSSDKFTPILAKPAFKALALYSYPWWENATSCNNITLQPYQRLFSDSTCLDIVRPYSEKVPHGEGIIQLSYSYEGCAVKWGELSKGPQSVFNAEINRAVRKLFPGMTVPDPLEVVYQYWEEGAWHVIKAGSNMSQLEVEKWAKRPLPGEEIYLFGSAYSRMTSWQNGALISVYNALKEGWGVVQPEP